MKKLPILLSILTFSAVLSGLPAEQSHALYIDQDDATWYTVAELLDYKKQTDVEKAISCGDDMGCQQDWYFNKIENDNKFLALEQLTAHQFVATSVNFDTETIKVLFFDEDMMLSRMGIREELSIENVYIAWFEKDFERIFNIGDRYDKFVNGEVEDAHTLYTWANGADQENQILSNIEVELKTPSLSQNNTGRLLYAIDSGPQKFGAVGAFIYESCPSEPDYTADGGCHLMFSAEKGEGYFPPRETIVNENKSDEITPPKNTEENSESNISDDDNNNDDHDTAEKLDTYPKNTQNNPEKPDTSLKNEQEIKMASTSTPTIATSAPNTGANTDLCNQKTIEFPWWLVIVIALGDAVVLWLFWPKGKKSPKKS